MTIEIVSERVFGSVTDSDPARQSFGAEIAALPDGRVALAWTRDDLGGDLGVDDDAVWTRIADASGVPLTDPIRVASDATGIGALPSVAPLGDGYVVVWTRTLVDASTGDRTIDTMLRVFDANGVPAGPQQVVSPTLPGGDPGDDNSLFSGVLALGEGGALVGYSVQGENELRIRTLDTDGTLGTPVPIETSLDLAPIWTQLANGDVAIALRGLASAPLRVRLSGPEIDDAPASGGSGPVVLDLSLLSGTEGVRRPAIAATADGGFALAYGITPDRFAQQDELRITRFSADGTEVGTVSIPLADGLTGFGGGLRLFDAGEGRLVVAYEVVDPVASFETRVRVIEADGTIGAFVRAHSTNDAPEQIDGAAVVDGDLLLAISGRGGTELEGGRDPLSLVRLELDGTAPAGPTPGPDDLLGGAGPDSIDLLAGDDRYDGGGGDDTILGSEGDDLLLGGAGDDLIDGGPGADTLEGGDGSDTYVVDRDDEVRETAGAPGTDEIRTTGRYALDESGGIERLVATGSANARLDGTSGDEALVGNAGRNILVGFGGEDTMTGGAGADTFVLTNLRGTPPLVEVTDFGEGDRIAVDDRLLGIGRGAVDVRDLTADVARELLSSGVASYNARRGELRIDADGDGTRELVADLGDGVRLGFDDVLLF